MDLPKIALFGYGYWGKKIANTLKNYSDFVVVDPFITDIPKNIQVVTLADVCASDQVIGCIIATPEGTHFELADQLLKAGKHVWVEKPLCLTAYQAEKLIATAQKMDKVLFVDTIFLFDPLAWLVADWISKQTSPILTWKSSRLSDRKPQQGLLPIDDLAIHDCYLLRFWFGINIIEKCEVQQDYKNQQTIKLSIHSSDTSVVNCEWKYSFGNASSVRKLELVTDEGSLVWEKQRGHELLTVTEKGVNIYAQSLSTPSALNRAIEAYLLLIEHAATTDSFFYQNCLNVKLHGMVDSQKLVISDISLLGKIRNEWSLNHRIETI